MQKLQEFIESYPKINGRYFAIGAIRQAWQNQIFFHNAKPDDMILAAKNYALNLPEYPHNAQNFLNQQIYLDPELQKPIKEKQQLTDWKAELAKVIGEMPVKMWFDEAELINDKLIIKNEKKLSWIKQKYDIHLNNMGISI